MGRSSVGCAGVAALSLWAGAAQGAVYWSYTNSNLFTWRVTGMVDLDQRRSVASGRPGLPNNGNMYCAPTAAVNIAAYAATHGYPSLPPGSQNWQSNSTSIYNAATSNISLMGSLMGTSATGGTTGGFGSGAVTWFTIIGGGQFDVVYRRAGAGHDVTAKRLGLRGVDGALVAFAYGRYVPQSTNPNSPNYHNLIDRTGGHVVTLNRVDINGTTQRIKYRDPASDGANSSQSSFATTVMPIQTTGVIRLGAPMVLSEMMTGANDGIRRFIDSYIAVFPRYGLTQGSSADGGVELKKIVPTPFRPAVGVQESTIPLPAGIGPILDIESAGDGSVHLLLLGDGSVHPAGLYSVDPIDHTFAQVSALANPKKMTMSRFDELYVLDGTTVRRFNCRVSPPTLLGSGGVGAGNSADAIDYSDSTDEVFVLSRATNRIVRVPRGLLSIGGPPSDALPTALPPIQGAASMAVHSADGSVLVAGDGSVRVSRLTRSPVAGIWQLHSGFDAPFAPKGLHYGIEGDVSVFGDGSVRQYRLVTGATVVWAPVMDSAWAGLSVGPFMHMSRSRTDYDGSEEGPEYRNLEASEIVGGTVESACAGDANEDRAVNFQDLNIVLSEFGQGEAWFEGDVNADGVVDFRDLNIVLSAFGAVCP
ncbi:MAG: hypothetical protein AB7G17_06885 [Phycisphaerales bacterium]